MSFGLGLTAYKGEQRTGEPSGVLSPEVGAGHGLRRLRSTRAERSLAISKPGPHHGVDQVMPTILDSREHMFFQVRHGDQDSTINDHPA